MAYQVLARKWRPRNFREMAGQGHVLKTLVNSLDNDRLHHAYLFTGTRGVGKTTIARILARCLNCEKGVTSEPCGQCSACTEIDEGRFIDLIEVDAASRTKVEDTRELLDNVQYSPTRGRYKVYLIDEVHMLSGHSFNALLKTLEEPPPHVKFLLATTDPQKLPVTVLSRCLQFNLKNISPERLVEHIKHILNEEGIPYEEPALWQLGRAAQGSVRDCLTLLDQAIGYCDGNITDAEVRQFLGTIDQAIIHQLVEALVAQDGKELLGIIATAADHAPDFSAVLADLLSYLHRVAVAQVVPEGIDNSQGDKASVIAHAGAIPAENLQLYYQIALKSREDMPFAIDARAGLEMALLRMLAFTPDGVPVVPESSLEQTGAGEAESRERVKKKPVASRTGDTDPPARPQEQSGREETGRSPGTASVKEEPVAVREKAAPAAHGVRQPETRSQTAKGAGTEPLNRNPVALEDLAAATWIQLFYQLPLEGITRSIASNCLLQSASPEKITLILDESQTSVYNEEHRRRINHAVNEYFDREFALEINPGEITEETPAAFKVRMDRERLQQAIETFENDEYVKEIVKRFSGDIQTDAIEPTTPKQY